MTMTAFIDPLVPLPEAAATLGISMPLAYQRIRRHGMLHPLLPSLVRSHEGSHARIFVRRTELDKLLKEGQSR